MMAEIVPNIRHYYCASFSNYTSPWTRLTVLKRAIPRRNLASWLYSENKTLFCKSCKSCFENLQIVIQENGTRSLALACTSFIIEQSTQTNTAHHMDYAKAKRH